MTIRFFGSGLGAVLMLAAVPARADAPPTLGTTQCGGTQPVHIVPIAGTHLLPPYPLESVRLKEQGNSVLKVAIAPNGAVVEDSIVQSSGSERLDSAALDYVKQNWRWQPMPDCKTSVSVAVSVAWRIRTNPLQGLDPATLFQMVKFLLADPADFPAGSPPRKAMVVLMAMVNDQGIPTTLFVLQPSGDPALDEKSKDIVRTRHHLTAMRMDGKPQGSMAIIGVIWTPPGETPPDPDQVGKVLELFAHRPAAPPPP
jgi:TonB family protein